MELQLYNTASRQVEPFQPLTPPLVRLYTCGMTVYNYTHIGHLRAYTNSDTLRRTLEMLGYDVYHVMNVTDVGHLTSDADEGEDKLEVGARKEGKTVWELARFYEKDFFNSLNEFGISIPQVICRATEHIEDQIKLIQALEEKGYTYRTRVGVIFDTSRFPRYADFAQLSLESQEAGHRVETDEERRQPWDFALWITNKPTHIMQWDSPWGRGFPGWHVECSAMGMRYLGETMDIHCGGIDHIPIHHTNEIAQSEAASGKTFSRFWMHSAFLNVDSQKMSKSLENFYTLNDLKNRGFTPLALKFFFYHSSYRKPQNFTWQALGDAQRGLVKLWQSAAALPPPSGTLLTEYSAAFIEALCQDLNTPRALSVLWSMLKSDADPAGKAGTLIYMDKVLALDLTSAVRRLHDLEKLHGIDHNKEQEAIKLAEERREMRKNRRFDEADRLRDKIAELGFQVLDKPDGFEVKPL